MKKMLVALLALIISTSVSMGALVVYDTFSDEVSTSATPAGWLADTPGTGEHSRIDSGSLDYSGFAASSGNSWGLGQGTADYYRDVPGISGLIGGDKVYYSFLMRMNGPLDAFSTPIFRLFNTASPTGSGLIVGWGTSDYTSNLMGFSLSNRNRSWASAVGADNQKTAEIYTAADTVYLIVLAYNRGTNYQASTIELWINPDPATFSTGTPPAATITMPSYQNSTGYNNEAIWNRIQFVSGGSGSGVANWQVDEFRIGRSWSDMIATSTAAPEPPVAAFTVSPTNGLGVVSLTGFTFNDTSTGSVTNRYWNFGDGNATNLTGSSVQYTYSSAGTYSVTLTASGLAGTDSLTKTDLITVSNPVAPTASFNASKTSGYAPLAVTFTGTSTGTITNRYWDFGDGSTTNLTANTIAHTYAVAGTYTVALTASGPAGSDTSTQVDLITAQEMPAGTFIIESDVADTSVGVYSNGTQFLYNAGVSPMSVGDDNYGSGKADACAIVVFKLPDLGGKAIVAANLAVETAISYPGVDQYPLGLDLYGVRYSANKTVLTNDYAFIDAPSGTLIQNNVWEIPSSAIYSYAVQETDSSGDAALASWITAQYADGAVAGDYVFLRYATDQRTKSAFYIASADSASNQVPTLTIVTDSGTPVPPPAPVVGLSRSGDQGILSWATATGSGYVYSVYYSTNLLAGFVPLATNLPDTVNCVTNTLDPAVSAAFYQIRVR